LEEKGEKMNGSSAKKNRSKVNSNELNSRNNIGCVQQFAKQLSKRLMIL